ncbi:hypothetical protein QTJ16_006079 [Diplocarpon rosae]|uniref:catechol O-methyltransferase n=1 Tax=Diplocarpon rosae TaxID=946125 RepID=A0AAD9WCZ8_9HELO|nr:hypothetical protein QTJ16_006079 [Diplocarpon rosae]
MPNMSSTFDPPKAYVPQGEVFFDDGREEELVQFVTSDPDRRGAPAAIVRAMDDFARTQKYLMNVGEHKGKIVTQIIQRSRPRVVVELGGYCGYSTILFADAARAAGGERYFCLERSPKFARNIEVLVEFAGLGDIVTVVVGPSHESIQSLHRGGQLTRIDLMFLDHYKPAYTTDLKLCESLGLIGKGTTLAADNVITPGNPPYLKYVRSSVQEKRMALTQERAPDTQNFPGRSATQYGDVESLSTEVQGNPNLVYSSQLIESWEPSGVPDAVEVTVCTGEEAL